MAAVEAQSLEATDEQPAEVLGLAESTPSQSATVFAPPLPLGGVQAGSQEKGELIGAHAWKEGCSKGLDELQRMPRRARWCDLAVDEVGGEPFTQPAHVEAFPALAECLELDMGLLRERVEKAIGFKLLDLTLEEDSTGAAAEVHLQLPEGGEWNSGIAHAVVAAARTSGLPEGFQVFSWQ